MYMIAEVSQYVAVASFTEAWIEIDYHQLPTAGFLVASFTEAWIEILSEYLQYLHNTLSPPSRRRGLKFQEHQAQAESMRRLLHGGVDWNKFGKKWKWGWTGRLLHGGVDWNIQSNGLKSPVSCVASFVEAWIEITWGVISLPKKSSPPSRRRGLKYGDLRFVPGHFGRLLHGGVDWNQSQNLESYRGAHVASFTEAWIEIGNPHCSSRCCYIVSSQR